MFRNFVKRKANFFFFGKPRNSMNRIPNFFHDEANFKRSVINEERSSVNKPQGEIRTRRCLQAVQRITDEPKCAPPTHFEKIYVDKLINNFF